MRTAFVSPLPPAATGIADYAADVLALLAGRHAIDLFHAQPTVDRGRLPAACAVYRAETLAARNRERPYEAVVHQLGNAAHHAFVYDLVSRVPGLLVLHELVLFHSRAAMFTDSEAVRAFRRDPSSAALREAARPSLEAWRQELAYSYGARGDDLYDAHLGTVGDLLPYAYPLFRIPVEASRAVAVHSAHAAAAVRAEVAGASVVRVPMPASAVAVDPRAVWELRRRLGVAEGEVVIGVFGLLTREKRVGTIARAVARAAAAGGRFRLLLAGPVPDRDALGALLERAGVRSLAIVTGRLPFEELATHIEAADLVAHLRWPSGRETSAALLRVLAQGRPAIVSDLAHQSELPADAVRRVDVAREEDDLVAAITELAGDPRGRLRLGRAAAAYVRAQHGPEAVAAAWDEALELCRSRPDPPARPWPPHWPRPATATAG
ncbi:MAG TPA: glycosyltransferase [Vicinamibacteria bacterium]|nr:glycosyltransferase [Vicinamibacteria bacterium]